MKHLDSDQLSAYFLNKLSFDEETAVQEHLRLCHECRKKLDNLRCLYNAFEENNTQATPSVFKRILHSGWTKAAASIIIIAGIGFFIYQSISAKHTTLHQNIINDCRDDNQVFATDTFDKQDSLYYMEQYGDDFKL